MAHWLKAHYPDEPDGERLDPPAADPYPATERAFDLMRIYVDEADAPSAFSLVDEDGMELWRIDRPVWRPALRIRDAARDALDAPRTPRRETDR